MIRQKEVYGSSSENLYEITTLEEVQYATKCISADLGARLTIGSYLDVTIYNLFFRVPKSHFIYGTMTILSTHLQNIKAEFIKFNLEALTALPALFYLESKIRIEVSKISDRFPILRLIQKFIYFRMVQL